MNNISPPPELILRSAPHSSIVVQDIGIRTATHFNSRLHYIPIALFLFFPTTFFLCYVVALMLGHINAFFAFISDAGTLPPEQNVFAQLVNVGAALFAYFVYIRYVQVEHYMRVRFQKTTTISNVIALAFGFISSLGMSVVGNFPELVIKEVHLIGAFLAFVGGSIYSILQGYFTFKMLPHFQTKCVAYMRVFLGILGLMLYFGAQSTIVVAYHKVTNKAKLESKPDSLKWGVEDGGYDFRAASVIMEWILLFIFDLFVVSFVSDFKNFKLTEPNVTFFMQVVDDERPEQIEEMSSGDGERDCELRGSDDVDMLTSDSRLGVNCHVAVIKDGGENRRVPRPSGSSLGRNKFIRNKNVK